MSETPQRFDRTRRLAAEALGTGFLLAVVVGSGIMGETLAGGNVALALLGNTLPTGAALVVLILIFGPISGGHFNPAVSLCFALRGELAWRDLAPYVVAQVAGGLNGVAAAHGMFETTLFAASAKVREGPAQWLSEFIATFGLLATILGSLRTRAEAVPYAVGLYVTAGYWFTASTCFANPAVTIARAFTDTFAGIRPLDAPAFIAVQLVGAVAAMFVFRWLWAPPAAKALPARGSKIGAAARRHERVGR
jgi:glycerol uptake facilitator-like aquaporin